MITPEAAVSHFGASVKSKLTSAAIAGAPEDQLRAPPAHRQRLIDNVTPEMWTYEVSGKQVLRHWFSYRCRDRSRPIIGDRRPPSPLDSVQPDGWLAEYTTDLLDLLHVIGRLVRLEPRQAELLDRILDGPLLSAGDLAAVAAISMPEAGDDINAGQSEA